MTAISPPKKRELLSPEELDQLNSDQRVRYYAEDWISAPIRADSGAALGPETQQQVLALLRRGVDEAEICETALAALAAEEDRITRQHRLKGWIAVAGCISIALVAAATWQGRGDGQHLANIILLGGIGLMIAQAIRSRGVRVRSRMMNSAESRKKIWRKAIAAL